MLKVLVACGCGMGSSLMIKQNCQAVLKKMGVECSVDHSSIAEAKTAVNNYDLVVVAENFVKNLKVTGDTKIVGLKNIMNKKELQQKLEESGIGSAE
ncbi:MAG: PTS sugar transporter subunit IIB [Lachnospiraceae bacterium]|nr:PTS sugar transporter subunit IIB [Lachnospiraceae bacterium]